MANEELNKDPFEDKKAEENTANQEKSDNINFNAEELRNMINNLTPEDLKISYNHSIKEIQKQILYYRGMEKQIKGQKQLTNNNRSSDVKKIKKNIARLSGQLDYLKKDSTKQLLTSSVYNKELILNYIDNMDAFSKSIENNNAISNEANKNKSIENSSQED